MMPEVYQKVHLEEHLYFHQASETTARIHHELMMDTDRNRGSISDRKS
jgi:hypothetical protein